MPKNDYNIINVESTLNLFKNTDAQALDIHNNNY